VRVLLTHELTAFQTQRVLRWRLYLEEFGPEFLYLKGELNTFADALSRVPTLRETSVGESSPVAFATKQRQELTLNQVKEETVESDFDEGYTILEYPELAECLLLHPKFDNEGRYPSSFPTIAKYQSQEPEHTAAALNPGNANIQYKLLGDTQVIVTMEADQRWQICIPDQSLDRFIMWYQ
jgi:hypothetical protein